MTKKSFVFRKGMVIGIIFLFVGAGVSPAISKQLKNSIKSQSEDMFTTVIQNNDFEYANLLTSKVFDKESNIQLDEELVHENVTDDHLYRDKSNDYSYLDNEINKFMEQWEKK